MATLKEIRLPGLKIPVLHEDRAMLAIDKPAGWMLAPEHAHRVINNLHALLMGSIVAGDVWARSRGIRFLRYVHRLDADTTGILLLAKSKGAIGPLSQCFARHEVDKVYVAMVEGVPEVEQWQCDLPLGMPQKGTGRVTVNRQSGKESLTRFRLLAANDGRALIACQPITGRTHQIRVHLSETAGAIIGDRIYGDHKAAESGLALRSVWLRMSHPFTRRSLSVEAPWTKFLRRYGVDPANIDFDPAAMTGSPTRARYREREDGRQEEEKAERGKVRRKRVQGQPTKGRSPQGGRRRGR